MEWVRHLPASKSGRRPWWLPVLLARPAAARRQPRAKHPEILRVLRVVWTETPGARRAIPGQTAEATTAPARTSSSLRPPGVRAVRLRKGKARLMLKFRFRIRRRSEPHTKGSNGPGQLFRGHNSCSPYCPPFAPGTPGMDGIGARYVALNTGYEEFKGNPS